jgi:3-oxoacyl-[acyl-carrier-protein] synthase II
MTPRRRVAITGLGMVTPLGCDVATTWESVRAGRSGVAPIRSFDARGFSVRIGAEVKALPPSGVPGGHRLLKLASRANRFALAAAAEAFADAGIRPTPSTAPRWGLSVGAGMMGVSFEELRAVHAVCGRGDTLEPDGLLGEAYAADPVAYCRSQSNAGLALLTRHFGIQGYATAVHTACASGGQALGTALKMIRRGVVDRMLAG